VFVKQRPAKNKVLPRMNKTQKGLNSVATKADKPLALTNFGFSASHASNVAPKLNAKVKDDATLPAVVAPKLDIDGKVDDPSSLKKLSTPSSSQQIIVLDDTPGKKPSIDNPVDYSSDDDDLSLGRSKATSKPKSKSVSTPKSKAVSTSKSKQAVSSNRDVRTRKTTMNGPKVQPKGKVVKKSSASKKVKPPTKKQQQYNCEYCLPFILS
jgi:hypothetical protein